MKRLIQHLWAWRWVRTLFLLIQSGVRVHPTAVLLGMSKNIVCHRGLKLGARVVIDVDRVGHCILGRDVWVSTDVEMQTTTKIDIGRGTTIQRRCTVNGTVSIGAQCIFAPNVFISSGSHIFRAWPEMPIRDQEEKYHQLEQGRRPVGFDDRPVVIGDDCWLGTNVVVMPGVVLGAGCVVGANSVVTKSFPSGVVIAGAPARQISLRCN